MSDDRFFASQHMRVSEEEYVKEYLPLFKDDIVKLLQLQPGEYSTVSFQEVHSRTYKCAGNQLSEKLLADVRQTVVTHVRDSFANSDSQGPVYFLNAFNEMAKQFLYSVQHVATAFTFLNKSYVEEKLHANLLVLFYEDFNQSIIDPLAPRLIESFDFVRSNPFALNPAIVSRIVWTLYMLNNDYVQMAPDLFALHIPNLTPAMREEDIPIYIDETLRIQQQLTEEGYSRCRPTVKRSLEMDTDSIEVGSNSNKTSAQ